MINFKAKFQLQYNKNQVLGTEFYPLYMPLISFSTNKKGRRHDIITHLLHHLVLILSNPFHYSLWETDWLLFSSPFLNDLFCLVILLFSKACFFVSSFKMVQCISLIFWLITVKVINFLFSKSTPRLILQQSSCCLYITDNSVISSPHRAQR